MSELVDCELFRMCDKKKKNCMMYCEKCDTCDCDCGLSKEDYEVE